MYDPNGSKRWGSRAGSLTAKVVPSGLRAKMGALSDDRPVHGFLRCADQGHANKAQVLQRTIG
eukprot:1854136-Lingulodinium_polyedra.AAC.1